MASKTSLEGRVAIVTGAAGGIGSATTRALAEEGAHIAAVDINEEGLDELVTELTEDGAEAIGVATDIRDPEDVQEMTSTVVDSLGGIDVLINNAGLSFTKSVEDLTTEEYLTMIETNVNGTFFVTQAGLPHLRESKGNLLFIASSLGKRPHPVNPVYAATKWWVRGFADSLRADVGEDGIAVTTLNPGRVRTGFGTRASKSDEGRCEPEDIANGVVFAVSHGGTASIGEIDVQERDNLSRQLRG